MNEDHYILLIYKKLNGEISSEELAQLEEWVNISPENYKTELSVTLAWNASSAVPYNSDIDLDSEFAFLQEKLEEEPIQFQKARRFKMNWLQLAAAVILLLGIGFILRSALTTKNPTVEWEEISSGEDVKTILLPDSSTVVLNRNSKLYYPKEFAGKERKIRLDGEAFFDVKRDAKLPFIIETNDEWIQVLGTSFSVKSTPADSVSAVNVVSGKVLFKLKNSGKELVLIENQHGVYNKNQNTLGLGEIKDNNNLAWATNTFDFNQTELKEVLKMLEKHFQVNFETGALNKNTLQCNFSGVYHEPQLENILSAISFTLKIEILRYQDRTYQLKGGLCE